MANDDVDINEMVNCTPVKDKQELLGFAHPLQESERKMLMDEIDNLRSERNMQIGMKQDDITEKATVSAEVLAHMKRQLYRVILMLNSVGDIIHASCSCPVGSDPNCTCKHTAALCYALEDFVKVFVLPEDIPSCSAAMKYGLDMEPTVINRHVAEKVKEGSSIYIIKLGLIIDIDHRFTAASPDDGVEENNSLVGIVEFQVAVK
ncbi:hypothetical protein CHS0354_024960 [Potamilus streckersoni]|uniref:SWIM-type domain-containing protein n=1 Tax=Potamilus streckersoni TaxID=2493646 RepID=A0AAE0T2C3_9BIVA|nr:hypothetical protein CHS0354_024960 [Potamilus streckersoni]